MDIVCKMALLVQNSPVDMCAKWLLHENALPLVSNDVGSRTFCGGQIMQGWC